MLLGWGPLLDPCQQRRASLGACLISGWLDTSPGSVPHVSFLASFLPHLGSRRRALGSLHPSCLGAHVWLLLWPLHPRADWTVAASLGQLPSSPLGQPLGPSHPAGLQAEAFLWTPVFLLPWEPVLPGRAPPFMQGASYRQGRARPHTLPHGYPRPRCPCGSLPGHACSVSSH